MTTLTARHESELGVEFNSVDTSRPRDAGIFITGLYAILTISDFCYLPLSLGLRSPVKRDMNDVGIANIYNSIKISSSIWPKDIISISLLQSKTK